MTDKTKEELLAEIDDLKTRLQEAEENLNAIRSGGVDALVISGPKGDQVFTLNEADRPYRIIIEEMSEGTITTNADGVILYSNKQFSNMLGVPLSKLIGSSLYEHTIPENRPTIQGLISGSTRDTAKAEVVFQGEDKENIWANVSFSPLEIDQTRVFCCVITDTTFQKNAREELHERSKELEERNISLQEEINAREQSEKEKKSLENQLIQSQKMEALGRFAGGIAHDLNNLLYPIIVDTEYLLEETVAETALHQTLEQILKAANRQRDLIRQILSFSRRREQLPIPMKLTPVLKETMDLLRSFLPSTITIEQHIDAPSDTILGDPTQIQQIIMNLFKNAADAIDSRRGSIEVSLVNACLEQNHAHPDMKQGHYLKLVVKDTGHGMTKEVIDRIFEPFFTTKDPGKGSGMGLAVVHGILKHHGGAITVESEQGVGSLFTVYLPKADETIEAQIPPTDNERPVKGKGNVLLVDDEVIILSSLQNALKRMGYDVVAMNDGEKANEVFRKAPSTFDVVITDLTMPQITGVDLAGKLIDIRPDIPVILCTGFNDVMDEAEAKSMGICEFLQKPASTNELKSAISRVLGNS
jgi:PAS domain S-box-containing protein